MDHELNPHQEIKIATIRKSQIDLFIKFMNENRGYSIDYKPHLSLFPLHNPELCFIATKDDEIFGMLSPL